MRKYAGEQKVYKGTAKPILRQTNDTSLQSMSLHSLSQAVLPFHFFVVETKHADMKKKKIFSLL